MTSGRCGRSIMNVRLRTRCTRPEVAAGLGAARSYWLSTTVPSGAPHVAPVWGLAISESCTSTVAPDIP